LGVVEGTYSSFINYFSGYSECVSELLRRSAQVTNGKRSALHITAFLGRADILNMILMASGENADVRDANER